MQVRFTAQEIADLAAAGMLPGLPSTKRGVNDLAARENWRRYHALARPRAGRKGGGGFEYHLDLLPLSSRLAYVAKSFRIDPEDLIAPLSDDGTMSAKGREARDAKIVMLRLADAFRRATGLTSRSADDYFCRLFNAGSVEVPDWLRDNLASLSVRTMARWRAAARTDTARLAFDPATARKGTGLLDTANDGAVRNFILGLVMLAPKHATAQDILIQCRSEFGEEIVDRHGEVRPMPPERTFQHFIKALKIEEEVAITKASNPDDYRNRFAFAGTNAFAWVNEPNQLWQIDASPIDVLCVDGRHSIYMCLDLATRRIVITTSKTPRAAAVGLMVRKAILKLGVSRTIKTDNGSDFVAAETCRLFDALGIEVQRSQKYTPTEKGHVERVIGTFQRAFGRKMPGFIGHNVADRKAIESRKSFAERLGCDDRDAFAVQLTAAELQVYIDRWIEVDYHNHRHGGLGGRTPNQMAEASVTTVRRVDERALDVLLLTVKPRVMKRKGFEIGRGHFYRCPAILPRARCLLRMDPADAGRAYVFTEDGEIYLGEAICYELAGIDPAEAVRADRAAREQKLRQIIDPARKAVRHLTGTAQMDRHLAVLERDAAAAAERSNVIRFPPREEVHTTPQIAAAIEAASPTPAAPLAGRAAEIHAQLLAGAAAPAPLPANVTLINPVEEAYGRFRRARRLERLQAGGQPLDEQDSRWLAGYREGPEYSALSLMPAGFDEVIGL